MIPRIIGIVGAAGSGKDTAAVYMLDVLHGEAIAFADPFKKFAGAVFGFTDTQLYGPSEARNLVDERLSFDPPEHWVISPTRYDGFKGKVVKFLDFLWPERLHNPNKRRFTQEQILRQRDICWMNFLHEEEGFLDEVLVAHPEKRFRAQALLRQIMHRIIDDERNISPRLVLQLIGSEFGRDIDKDIWAEIAILKCQKLMLLGKTPIIKDVRFINEAKRIKAKGGHLLFISRENQASLDDKKAGVAGHRSEAEMDSAEMKALIDDFIDNNDTLNKFRDRVRNAVCDA